MTDFVMGFMAGTIAGAIATTLMIDAYGKYLLRRSKLNRSP